MGRRTPLRGSSVSLCAFFVPVACVRASRLAGWARAPAASRARATHSRPCCSPPAALPRCTNSIQAVLLAGVQTVGRAACCGRTARAVARLAAAASACVLLLQRGESQPPSGCVLTGSFHSPAPSDVRVVCCCVLPSFCPHAAVGISSGSAALIKILYLPWRSMRTKASRPAY